MLVRIQSWAPNVAGLKAAGLDPGKKDVLGTGDKTGEPIKDLPVRPNERFEVIKENNKDKAVKQ